MKKLIIKGIVVTTLITLPLFNHVNQESDTCPQGKLLAEDGSCVNEGFWDNDTQSKTLDS